MNTALLTGLISVSLYGIATLYVAMRLFGKREVSKGLFLGLGVAALLFHTISVQQLIFTTEGVNLGIFRIGSLVGWLAIVVAILTSIVRPFENITATAYPVAIVTVVLSISFGSNYTPRTDLTAEMTSHILLSILAYSVLAIAVGQAVLIAAQNYQLKHKQTLGIIQVLPPLQTMESVLFEIIWIGMAFLSLAIASGFLFLEDIFAQQVAHKSFFSIVAWFVFGVLLWGRHKMGWRGKTAIRWTLSGFVLLMIGFFGSKVVLEIILSPQP